MENNCIEPKSYYEGQKDRLASAKERIAKYAAEKYIAPGDSIVIDAGTSLTPVAKYLGENRHLFNYSIMTHNSEAFDALKTETRNRFIVFLSGGRYVDDLKAFFGDHACKAYESFGPQKVFIGVSALSAGGGLRCQGNTEEIQVKKTISKLPTQDRIILADFTKFGRQDALKFASTYDLSVASDGYTSNNFSKKVNVTIVTNKPNQEDYDVHLKYLEKMGVDKTQNPSLKDFKERYSIEISSFRELGIKIDEVP